MKRRAILGRELTFGAPIPRGWRMAWYEPRRRVGIYFPAGLHWLMRAVREWAWRIGLAWNAHTRERHESEELQRVFRERQRLAEEYAGGYLAGWQECLEACVEALEGGDGGGGRGGCGGGNGGRIGSGSSANGGTGGPARDDDWRKRGI